MKKVFFLLLATVFSTAIFAQDPATVVKFAKMEYDFGKIKQNVPVSFDFLFKNISTRPIAIENASASCGCTTPVWPKVPVLAGKSNKVKAGFNAANVGPFEKSITIKLKDVVTPIVVKIKGEVLTAEDYAKLPRGKTKKA